MDTLTSLLALLLTLSLATERVTEAVKGLPLLSKFLANKELSGTVEDLRKAAIHVIAIAIGTYFAAHLSDQIANLLSPSKAFAVGFPVWVIFGALASSGSGLWNSTLDAVREVSKQKELLTKQIASQGPESGGKESKDKSVLTKGATVGG